MGVTEILDGLGIPYEVVEHPPARHESELHLTGLDVGQGVKTLAFSIGDEGRVALVGIPGPARLRYGDLARALGVARSQLRPAAPEAVAAIGMEPGGLSPISAHPHVSVLFDVAVPEMGTVWCGAGDPTRTLVLDAADLVRATPNVVVARLA